MTECKVDFIAWNRNKKKIISFKDLVYFYNLKNVLIRPDMCEMDLMTYTGYTTLEDNQKIYSDFIVLCRHYTSTEKSPKIIMGVVEFNDCRYVINDGFITHHIIWSDWDIEVLGNKYENPEMYEKIINEEEDIT